MGLSWAPVDFTGAIARTKADTNTSALKVKIRFIFCLLIRMNQILCLAMLLRGVVSQDLIGFLPLVKATPKLRNWGLLLRFLSIVLVLVLELFAREWYHPVGSIDYGFFDHRTAYQRPRTRTTTRTI